MSFSDFKREAYQLQRSASNGAGVTLVSTAGEFRALFECATHCAQVLGERDLKNLGEGENIPAYHILSEDLYSALAKLTQRFSVALVEYAQTRNGGQFVCLCKIPHTGTVTPGTPANQPTLKTHSKNVNDY